ncbi:MAG: TetR/AcrR family transcriptional regulator [Sporichthyaceae bacterium]
MTAQAVPPPTARRVRLVADDRREQILAAAQRLFAERPYSEVSTTELSEAAGTTRTNLHHYFGTKRELYLEVLRRFGRLPALPPDYGRATGESELRRLFARWLEVLEDNRETIISMIGAGSFGADHDVREVFHEGLRAWEDRLLAVLEVADLPTNRARIRSYQGMVSSAVVQWLREGDLTREQVFELLVVSLVALPWDSNR